MSGVGSNLQALLDAAATDPGYPRTVAVGADRPEAAGLERAHGLGIPTFVLPVPPGAAAGQRPGWDAELVDRVAAADPDLVVCAGFMRVLGPAFLDRFAPGIVNTHPALLPAFPGAHAVRDALAYGVLVTGATVHLVDGGVDTGPVVAQAPVEVRGDDDEASLHARIKEVEQAMLVRCVRRLAAGFTVEGRKVRCS